MFIRPVCLFLGRKLEHMKEQIHALLEEGIRSGCFPCGAAAVGCGDTLFAMEVTGRISLPDGADATLATRYDMASCTKIMGATMLALQGLEQGKLTLDDTIGRYFDAPEATRSITIRQLMTHTSGIVPHLLLQEQTDDPTQAVQVILHTPLAGEAGVPRYSCMGYIVLGNILERIYGDSLDQLAKRRIFDPLGMTHTGYCPTGDNFAATEIDPTTGRMLQGVVHDENARFLGGVSANAGIFSDIQDCVTFAQMLARHGAPLLTKATMDKAIHNYTPGFDVHRGLGFHLGGTECNYTGDLMPSCSFGHTGFTGTSIAVDPTTGFFAVLLTNRVHPSRENVSQLRFRRLFHNAAYSTFLRKQGNAC